ncbi:tRNA-Phe hydroxylase [Aureococcus anophagefferens]|nr:tRNA-Phe hydroxylase [Aureococcus anophagefferens]
MFGASSSKAAPRPSCGGASTASYPDVLRRVAAATRPRDGGSPSGESDASATSAAMVTQEEDDPALPGDSPLWEFLGALVRAEAAILGDAADEERRRLDATPARGQGRR